MRYVCGGELSSSMQGAVTARVDCKDRIVVEEADETIFWLEMLEDCGIVTKNKLAELLKEAHELCAIFAAARRTAKGPGKF
jgi:hypothetical protein